MRKLLIATTVAFAAATAAQGADLPRPYTKVAAIADPAYNWTGFYAGVNAGYGWGRETADYAGGDTQTSFVFSFNGPVGGGTSPGPAGVNPKGAFGGVQAGYNWQINKFVVGVEADFDGADIRGRGVSPFLFNPNALAAPGATMFANQHVKWFGTVRGRIGFTLVEKLLLYATGGFAYARIDEDPSLTLAGSINASGFGFGFSCTANVTCFQGSSSRTATGGTVGAGAEYALSRNITVKAEYLFMSLNGASTRATALVPGGPAGSTLASVIVNFGRLDLNTVRVGLNYKFGNPVVARY